jgi:competence protein ComEC
MTPPPACGGMKFPLAPIAAAFLSGVALAHLKIPLIWVLLLSCLVLLGAIVKKQRVDGCLVLLFFALGLARYWSAVFLPQEDIAFLAPETAKEIWLVGKIQSDVTDRFVLSVEGILLDEKWLPTAGKILVHRGNFYPREEKFGYGDRILLSGLLSQPSGSRNPGGWSYRKYLAAQGIHALVSLKQELFLLEKDRSISIWEIAYFLKGILRHRIQKALAPEDQGLIQALLLGERGTLSPGLKEAFVKTGTVHILAISGLHVGMIVWGLLFLLKFLRVPRRPRFLTAMVLTGIYALIASAGPAVMRAAIMAEIYLLGKLLGRSHLLLNSLSASVLAILFWNPLQILDIGFWLSFLSVLALILICPLFHPAIEGYPQFFKETSSLILTSLSVLVVITPIVSSFFNLFYPVTFLANLAAIPLSSLLLGCAFLAAFLGPMGHWFWSDVHLLEIIFIGIVEKCAQIPGGFWFVPRLPVWIIVAYYCIFVLLISFPREAASFSKKGQLLALWFLFLNLLFWFPLLPRSGPLKVTFFDVGHGDAALVEFPKGETLLIDTGREKPRGEPLHPVIAYLRMRGIRFLDGVVLTHADQDHIGALDSLRKEVRIAQLWDNGFKDSAAADYRARFKQAGRYRVLNQGDRLVTLSGVDLDCLNPPAKTLDQFKHRNDASLVLRLVDRRIAILFAGDVEGLGIETLLALPRDQLACAFLKVPHHGSDLGGYASLFFSRTHPQSALISMAIPNRWNLPNASTLEQLASCQSMIFLTAKEGGVCFQTDGESRDVISLKERSDLWYNWHIHELSGHDEIT